MPYVIMGLLALLLVVGLIAFESTKKKTTVEPGVRTVVLPPSPAARTIVIAPCDAPLEQTARNVVAGTATPGATALKLPPIPGPRTVVIPGCQPMTGIGANLPSAALIPSGRRTIRPAKPAPPMTGVLGDPDLAQTRVLLPTSTTEQTLVLAPCPPTMSMSPHPDVSAKPVPQVPNLLIAPPCP